MRELAFGARKSGRTTTLLLTVLEEMEMHDKPVYVVTGKFCIGVALKNLVRKYNEDSSRVHIISLDSLSQFRHRGLDPRNIYIEHTAYEMATSRQLAELYSLEDAKDNMTFGAMA